jgi:hypothetical protein
MAKLRKYIPEYALIILAMVLSVSGFWNIFFGSEANPSRYHYFHVITVFTWLFLLLFQLSNLGRKRSIDHKKLGISIIFFGPLLVATTAVMTVHSAYKGVVSGQGDPLFVQNVVGTIELAFLIVMAFVFKKRRAVHGAFLLSTVLAFIGVALFFTLLGFVPLFKIEGPETFYRFAMAGIAGLAFREIVGILFFLKDRRNNWPMLLAGIFPPVSFAISALLDRYGLLQPTTGFVGSFNEIITFCVSFMVLLVLLLSTGILVRKRVDTEIVLQNEPA